MASDDKPLSPPPRLTTPAASESDYYKDRANEALAAMKGALASAKREAAVAADPRGWAQKKPLIALGVAAAGGLAAGYAATPSKKNRAARRLATIERILDAEAKARGVNVKARKAGGRTWRRKALQMGIGYAKPMIISTLTGLLSGAAGGATAGQAVADDDEPQPRPGAGAA